MEALSDLLSARVPQFQTHQALLVIGLQEDFLSTTGKLPVPTDSGFVERIKEIVPRFRDAAGEIIWVRTVVEPNATDEDVRLHERAISSVLLEPSVGGSLGLAEAEDADAQPAELPPSPSSSSSKDKHSGRKGSQSVVKGLLKKMSSRKNLPRSGSSSPSSTSRPTSISLPLQAPTADDELFLTPRASREPCCINGTSGAEFPPAISDLMHPWAGDITVTIPRYSAFDGTTLLTTLRTKFITELYLCGCLTNVSVYATALDAAQHGIRISVVEDCLGYRELARHKNAVRQLADVMGATMLTSVDMLADLSQPTEAEAEREEGAKEIEGLLAGMKVKGDRAAATSSSTAPGSKATKATPSSSPPTVSKRPHPDPKPPSKSTTASHPPSSSSALSAAETTPTPPSTAERGHASTVDGTPFSFPFIFLLLHNLIFQDTTLNPISRRVSVPFNFF